MWNEICSKVFSECVETLENKKIEYFILRNYKDLPEKNSGKDVDIVVNPKMNAFEDMTAALNIANRILGFVNAP